MVETSGAGPELSFLGAGLNRAECVLTHSSGALIAADWTGNGGVSVIMPDGRTGRVLAADGQKPLRPNGIALDDDGSILVAHLGDIDGGIWRLHADGTVQPVLTEVDGEPLPPTNFVYRDENRLWITVSTRHSPRQLAYRADIADGFIALANADGARIVADNLGYTNECVVSPDRSRLYVNETFARRTTEYEITPGGLGNKRTVASYGEGVYPDGVVLDSEGALWVTSLVSNRVIRVCPNGGPEIILEDADHAVIAAAEAAYREGRMSAEHLNAPQSGHPDLTNVSSLSFGGHDLKTACLGSLGGKRIASFRADVAGIQPQHWNVDISALIAAAGNSLVES
jgi:sugar lactone lactonase YvrE